MRSRGLTVFVACVGVLGAGAVGLSIAQLPSTPYPLASACMALMAIVAGRFALLVPGVNVRLLMADTFFFTSALLFGPAAATVTVAIDSLLTGLKQRNGQQLQRVVFNLTGPALSFWVGIQVFFMLTGTGPSYGTKAPADGIIVPLACLAATYFLLNSGLVAIAIGLERRQSPIAVWRKHLAPISLNYFASASAAFFLFVVVQYLSLIALAALVPLIAVLQLAMKSWMGRMEDAERHIATVDRLYLSTIEALSTAIEAKDGVTSSHIHRVQHYAMGLARALGVNDEPTLKAIQAAALLHDTGKLAVPERILNKPGKLTPAEFETMKLHVEVGADILSSIDFPYPVVPIVRAHHESWDGTGYPNGLRGEAIPIGARILSVVDCYDALTSDRPYRTAMSDEEAMRIVRSRRGTMYDPAVVDAFAAISQSLTPSFVSPPQLQKAVAQISRAAEAQVKAEAPPAAVAEGPEALMALVNLSRIVTGQATATDVTSVAWSHLSHVVPGASCALYLTDQALDAVVASFVAGEAAPALQGLRIGLGDRLSGWVAANRQAIINSDAQLDLGPEAVFVKVRHCVALPLMVGPDVIGVLSVYGTDPFRDEQVQMMQMVAPHLAQMLVSLKRRQEDAAPAAAPARRPAADLRVVGRP